jgi:hypothetical protein
MLNLFLDILELFSPLKSYVDYNKELETYDLMKHIKK